MLIGAKMSRLLCNQLAAWMYEIKADISVKAAGTVY